MVKLAIRAQPYCGRCGSTEDLTGDHIVPFSQGGMDVPSNIRVLCRSCNAEVEQGL
jgi:5-methylcytosine-specific restriction endonuclease McrA